MRYNKNNKFKSKKVQFGKLLGTSAEFNGLKNIKFSRSSKFSVRNFFYKRIIFKESRLRIIEKKYYPKNIQGSDPVDSNNSHKKSTSY